MYNHFKCLRKQLHKSNQVAKNKYKKAQDAVRTFFLNQPSNVELLLLH